MNQSESKRQMLEKFIQETGLTDFEETFLNEELSLDNILKLTNENLKDIGISKLGQRIKILESIETFKAKTDLGGANQNEETTGTKSNESETAANLTMSSKSQATADYSFDKYYDEIDVEGNNIPTPASKKVITQTYIYSAH